MTTENQSRDSALYKDLSRYQIYIIRLYREKGFDIKIAYELSERHIEMENCLKGSMVIDEITRQGIVEGLSEKNKDRILENFRPVFFSEMEIAEELAKMYTLFDHKV